MKRFAAAILALCLLLPACALAETGFSSDPDAIERAAKSVLMLEVYDADNELLATGSGFVAFDNRTLVTNYHVIEDADWMVANSDDGYEYMVTKVLVADEVKDIAICGFMSPTDLTPLTFSDGEALRRAEPIVAIGSPIGITNTVSLGNISAIYEEDGVSWIQFTAPISSGSSGGVLFDDRGCVIGVTSASYEDAQNLNLAVDIAEVTALYESWNGETKQLSEYADAGAAQVEPSGGHTDTGTTQGEPSGSHADTDITGDWYLTGMLFDGAEVSAEILGVSGSLSIFQNGTLYMDLDDDGQMYADWELTGADRGVLGDSAGTIEFVLRGGALILQLDDDGEMIFERDSAEETKETSETDNNCIYAADVRDFDGLWTCTHIETDGLRFAPDIFDSEWTISISNGWIKIDTLIDGEADHTEGSARLTDGKLVPAGSLGYIELSLTDDDAMILRYLDEDEYILYFER